MNKLATPKIVVKLVTVTPDMALEMLEKNTMNRNIDQKRVDKYATPKSWEAEKELTTAPEMGYKNEIAIDLGEKNKKFYVFCYIKQGDHYGKARLGPVYIQEEKNKIQLVKMNVRVSFNTLDGDRNVNTF